MTNLARRKMRARHDHNTLDLARARTALRYRDGVGRVAARKTLRRVNFEKLTSAYTVTLSQPDLRARVILFAASAYHSIEISQAIGGDARAAVAAAVSSEARKFALSRRDLSGPGLADSADFAARFEATRADITTQLEAYMCGATVGAAGHMRCLIAALADVSATSEELKI